MKEVTVYTTDYCPYCTSAKRLLSERGLAFKVVDVTHNPTLRQKLSQENNGYRTVPMIFFGENFIGGYTDLAKLDKEKNLKELTLS